MDHIYFLSPKIRGAGIITLTLTLSAVPLSTVVRDADMSVLRSSSLTDRINTKIMAGMLLVRVRKHQTILYWNCANTGVDNCAKLTFSKMLTKDHF